MPACGFNMFHRGAAKGPKTETAPWGKKPWTTNPPVNAAGPASFKLPVLK